MRARIQSMIATPEIGDFADDLRQVFRELGRASGADGLVSECSPPLDVRETDQAVEITMDLPGVPSSAVRVVVKGSAVLIAGIKAPPRGRGDSSFHLIERGFGRFVRSVRLAAACDASRARAVLLNGELRLTLPRIAERRGRPIPVTLVP